MFVTPEPEERPTLAGFRARFADLERQRRQVEAGFAELVGDMERAGCFRADGHTSVQAWLRACGKWSDPEVRDAVRVAHLRDASVEVAAALSAGEVGVAQVRCLAKTYANPRVADRLVVAAPVFLAHAPKLAFAEFRRIVEQWERLVDVDGAHQVADEAHRGRDAFVVPVGAEVMVHANGPAGTGAAMREIFDRFVDAEFSDDWAWVRATYGDQASAALMPRTPAQRRYDALFTIFQRAAATPVDAKTPEPLVHLVIDHDTLQAILAGTPVDDSVDPRWRHCHTLDGTIVSREEALAALIEGQVRRVVVDSTDTVIAYGRTRRLFTGAAKKAVHLLQHACPWPGCPVPAHRCQADHLLPWDAGGGTDPHNGGPGCGHHNRFRNKGFRVWRDPNGYWHTYRPDGTEIT